MFVTKLADTIMTAGGTRCLSRLVPFRSAALLFLLLLGAGVGADNLSDVLERSNFNESQKQDVQALFSDCREAGVPDRLLLPRLEEGVAKRVTAARVLSVLRQNLDTLVEARSILTDTPGGASLLADDSSWLRTANLLASGLDAEEIGQIAASSRLRQKDYREATSLYVSLLEWGLSRADAMNLVQSLLSSSVAGEDFAMVTELLAAGRRLRIPPEELIRRIEAELPTVDSVEQLQDRILFD